MSFPEYLPHRLNRESGDATAASQDQILNLGSFGGCPGLTTATYADFVLAGRPQAQAQEGSRPHHHLRLVHDSSRQPGATQELYRWLRYLDDLALHPVQLPPDHARAVRRIWAALNSSLSQALRPPAAGPGGDLGFQLSWNTDDFYLDIDIASDGSFEWFWTDRHTDEYRGSDDQRLTSPPEELVQLLVRCCLAR